MVDLARAYSEVKSLPDEVLQREMSSPSGMLPSFIVLGELSDRQSMRGGSGGSFAKKPSIAQQIMQGVQPQGVPDPNIPSFYSGGAVGYKNAEKEYARLASQLTGELQPPHELLSLMTAPVPKSLSELLPEEPRAPLPSSISGLSRLLRG